MALKIEEICRLQSDEMDNVSSVLQILSESVRIREYGASVELFSQSDFPQEIFLVDSGLVKLTHVGINSQEMILGLRSRGAFLGAAAAILQKPHPISAITLSNCCLYSIPSNRFLYLVRTNTKLGEYLQQMHCHEVYNQAIQLAESSLLSARQRLERLLHQMLSAIEIRREDNAVKLRLPLKYREIAQLVGVTPEHLSRVLKRMEDDGTVVRENDTLTVFDLNNLCSASNY